MPKLKILAIEDDPATVALLREYFSETHSVLVHARNRTHALDYLKNQIPSLVFIDPARLTKGVAETLCGLRKRTQIKIFLTDETHDETLPFDAVLKKPLEFGSFQRQLYAHLTCVDAAKVLIVDDDREICTHLKEFLELRSKPRFEVDYALDGLQGFQKLGVMSPDCVVLDLKMPLMTGWELYREIRRKYPSLRVLIFSALVGTDELREVRRWGSPVIVEKGCSNSSYPNLTYEIEKQLVFS